MATMTRRRYASGSVKYENLYHDVTGKLHGITRGWHKDGQLKHKRYYLYGNKVTQEEFKKHELIKKLSGL